MKKNVIDQYPAHPTDCDFSNLNAIFYPANCISDTMDMGMI